jgi:hypothetical protein
MSYLCYLCLFEYSGVRCNIVHLSEYDIFDLKTRNVLSFLLVDVNMILKVKIG